MNPLVECKGLVKNYGANEALRGIDLTVGRGRIVGLLGPNGSGKSTLIKTLNGLITPTSGSVTINGMAPGVETKKIVSYLPDRVFLSEWMRVGELLDFYGSFYENFNREKALSMLSKLNIGVPDRLKTMSKGTKDKVQLILVMSRNADLYLLDEPIGGVDPAARDYILETVISNYSENSSVIISTHLIADVEGILDDVIFINRGNITLQSTVDAIREANGKSVDELFREAFKC